MARFCPLFSSSKGNCIYIGCSDSGILVDVGICAKNVCGALNDNNIPLEQIKAILITHSHSDHISGLKVLAKKLAVPIIMSKETANTLKCTDKLPENASIIDSDASKISIGDIVITGFCTSHDCPGSRGYTVSLPDGNRIAVCTDLGYISEEVHESLLGCSLVMLESNHDITMLRKGPYPAELKRRILSNEGHLSNISCAAELPSLVENGTTRIVLGHLSLENNIPSTAFSCAKASLTEKGYKEDIDYILYVAPQKGGKMITL